MTDTDLLFDAIKQLDGAFGPDFAQAHPEIVVVYMQAAANLAVANALINPLNEPLAATLGDSLDGIAAAIEGVTQRYNSHAEALHTVAAAIENVAYAIQKKE